MRAAMHRAEMRRARWTVWGIALAGLTTLAACGNNGNGSSDTVLTGFSGVLIFGIVVWIVYRYVKGRT